MSELVELHQEGPIVTWTMNNPATRNGMDMAMMDALNAVADRTEALNDARVVLLRGAGKGFSAGLDVSNLQDIAARFGENWRHNLFPLTAAWQRALNKIERLSLPVIALIHNYALGGGFEIALACDFRIVSDDARIGLPESKLGLIPDVGGTARLTQLVGPSRAKELIMTGRHINLSDAERWGIVNQVVPEAELEARGRQLAEELIQAAPLAVSYAKRVINDIASADDAMKIEAWAQAALFRSHDFEIGIQAWLTRQPPNWTGS